MQNNLQNNAIKILNIIANNNGEGRFVGGSVRDEIAGLTTSDIDIATNLTPQKITKILEAEKISVIPTGIEFGTVTAVIAGQHFEITTLRRDILPNGRHTKVEYTENWLEDAERRDFTFNALYKDVNGKIYDYFNGIEDLKNGVVHFIGDAELRIIEDYLRVLRLFRFQAIFGKQPILPDAIAACSKLKDGLNQISGERINVEMLKILALKNQYQVLQTMFECGVLQIVTNLYDEDFDLQASKKIASLEQKINPITTLCALLNKNIPHEKLEQISARWRLSNKQKSLLNRLHESLNEDFSDEKNTSYNARKACRINGKDEFCEYIILAYLKDKLSDTDFKKLINFAAGFLAPEIPISGQILLANGHVAGKELGQKLKLAEIFWEQNNYAPTKEMLLELVAEASI
jgi:poly(A) polymerase